MKVINLFGASGAGKSTIASGLFCKMKLDGYKVELVTEFAKGLIYEKRLDCLYDQLYVTGIQNHHLFRLLGKVDFAITDSPILLGVLHMPNFYPKSFETFMVDMFNTYDNLNIFLNRKFSYDPNGRKETEEESNELSIKLKKLLKDSNVNFHEFSGDMNSLENIYNFIKNSV